MRHKTLKFAAASALTLGLVFAQGSKEIVVIVKATNSEYWQTVFSGARKAGAELASQGVKLSLLGAAAETDIAGQINILETATARKPAAIVIAPTAAEPLGAPVTLAAKSVPIIMIDSSATTTAYTSFLTTNNFNAGKKAADALAAEIKAKTGAAKGKVAILNSLAGVGSLTARDDGFKAGLKAYPGLTIVATRIGGDDVAKAIAATLDLTTATPDLVGIFADNQNMGNGAGKAISDSKLESKVAVIAFDSGQQEIAFLKTGALDGLVLQDPFMMGYAGVYAGLYASQGKKLPKDVDTGALVATQKNFNTPAVQGLLDAKKRVINVSSLPFK